MLALLRRLLSGAGSCGVEKWLEGVQMMVEKGGISGIFLDGFQGCDPFFPRLGNGSFGVGCTRICGARSPHTPELAPSSRT